MSDYSRADVLAQRIHTLELVVVRPYGSRSRATRLLKEAARQYDITAPTHGRTVMCFDRVGIEWHLSWAAGLWDELRPGNVSGFMGAMLKAMSLVSCTG